MNTVVVRCAGCRQLSRVAAEAVGLEVVCPRCAVTFVARPESAPDDPPFVRRTDPTQVPVVHPRTTKPINWDAPPAPPEPEVERIPPTGGLIAIALLPFGIPLLWLLASAVINRPVVMSFAVPVALAVGVTGLGFGIAYVTRWSVATRVKALVVLLLVAYLAAGFLFVVKKEWLQSLRRAFPRGENDWQKFPIEPTKKPPLIGYSVEFPAGEEVREVRPPFPGEWKAFECKDAKQTDNYATAVGRLPGIKLGMEDDPWFKAMGEAIRAAAPARAAEPKETPVSLRDRAVIDPPPPIPGREFHFTRPDDILWHRVVRVYRVKDDAIIMAVEGPNLTPDAADVVHFLESVRVPVKFR